jgi:hypothetical protein
VVVVVLGVGATAQKPPRITFLKNQEPFHDCGCLFSRDSEAAGNDRPYVFAAPLDGPAWVNLGGPDLRVPPFGENSCAPTHPGDKCSWAYRDGETRITLSAKVTQACRPDDESCEGVKMRGTLTAEVQGQKSEAAVAGTCGC